MKDNKTIEANKLIALFMGLQVIPPRHYNEMNSALEYFGIIDKYGTVEDLQSQNNLSYEKDWAKLMPVVEKIEAMGHKTIIGGGDQWGNYMNIMYSTPNKKVSLIDDDTKALGQGENKIEAVYKAVVQFIKWYNLQK